MVTAAIKRKVTTLKTPKMTTNYYKQRKSKAKSCPLWLRVQKQKGIKSEWTYIQTN